MRPQLYENSSARPESQTHEGHAAVIAQVGDQLRDGSYERPGGESPRSATVTGVGHSFGGRTVMLSQGLYAPFAAIAAIAWSHGGYPQEFRDCLAGRTPCPDALIDRFIVREFMDPLLVAAFDNFTHESPPPNSATVASVTLGFTDCIDPALEPARVAPDAEDAMVAPAEAPVLILLGEDDYVIQVTSQSEEETVFVSSDDVTVAHLEETGHMVWHRLSHEAVLATILDWLDERNL